MAETYIVGRLQIRRGPTLDRSGLNLSLAEPGWDTELKQMFIGDGVTPGGIGVGTVTSVGLETTSNGLIIENSPITTNGNLSINLNTNLQDWSQISPSFFAPIGASGDISTPGSEIFITINNIKIAIEYKNTVDSRAYMQTLEGTEFIDVRIVSIYNGAIDNSTYDGYTLTTSPLIFDTTLYNDSNEFPIMNIRENNRIWQVGALVSGNGARANLWARRVM